METSQQSVNHNKATSLLHGDLAELANHFQVELSPLMIGVQCDLERVLEVFSYSNDRRFEAFSRLWWEHDVYKLFYGKKRVFSIFKNFF